MARKVFKSELLRLLKPIPSSWLRHAYYFYKHGRWGSFKNPRLFSEWVQHRMLYDRSSAIAATVDKVRMKDFALSKVPSIRVPETYWQGRDIGTLDLTLLPERWVMKPNHRSQLVVIGDSTMELRQLQHETRSWHKPYERIAIGEWAYTQARNLIIVEEFIGTGEVPPDYKFYVFGGEPKLIEVHTDRFGVRARTFYSPEWERIDLTVSNPSREELERPEGLSRMLEDATKLGSDFDFMRVDLYDVDGETWFGELTPYPTGGMKPFRPASYDEILGEWWSSAAGRRG